MRRRAVIIADKRIDTVGIGADDGDVMGHGAQRQHQAFPRHLKHVEARLARGRLKVSAGRSAEMQDLQLGVDKHAGRSELIDCDAVGLALGVDFAAEIFRRLCLSFPYRQGRSRPR